jgi:hypothetical protein
LQFNFDFTGGILMGTSNSGGTATNTGSTSNLNATGSTDATGASNFSSNSGSSGYIYSPFGAATGSSNGGATGSQDGSVNAMFGVGGLSFGGTTTSSGMGGFGAGFSPVNFNEVTTEIPGTASMVQQGGKKGGFSTVISDPTFTTTFNPVSTGPTGGFGTGSGALDITSMTTGTLAGGATTIGTGTNTGTATSSGGGQGIGFNYFGKAGGLGSGAATGTGTGSGNTAMDTVGGVFTGMGMAVGNFNNGAFGSFGTNGALTFPFGP